MLVGHGGVPPASSVVAAAGFGGARCGAAQGELGDAVSTWSSVIAGGAGAAGSVTDIGDRVGSPALCAIPLWDEASASNMATKMLVIMMECRGGKTNFIAMVTFLYCVGEPRG